MPEITVPTISIVFMAISAIGSFLIPLLLLLYYRKNLGVSPKNFFWGMGVFIIAVYVLESTFVALLKLSPIGTYIDNNIWINGLLGGLCAGIFEELGRYFAFSRLVKNNHRSEALAYGAGHGGAEAIIILGIGMISNFAVSYMINSGSAAALVPSGTDAATAAAVLDSFRELAETKPYMFIIGFIERCLAIILHLALSVLVFAAAKRGRTKLLPAAIGIHALVNAAAIIIYALSNNPFITEAVVLVLTAGAAYLALKVYYSISEV
ncbi:MAG: YhfC family intramembrane metalloprotease [Ruminococcaceae bacterium]|nr:YhfC family intramembrane metalloprotease [Oscillospiraceae bacterium]